MFLLDQNLSHFLKSMLQDVFQQMHHLKDFDMISSSDKKIWDFARAENYTIITKDSDFYQMSMSYGFPPKIIWLNLGNCSTKHIADVLRRHKNEIEKFVADKQNSFLILTYKKF